MESSLPKHENIYILVQSVSYILLLAISLFLLCTIYLGNASRFRVACVQNKAIGEFTEGRLPPPLSGNDVSLRFNRPLKIVFMHSYSNIDLYSA